MVFEQISNYVDDLIRFKERLLSQTDENTVNQMLIQSQSIRMENLQQELGQAIFLKSSLYPSLIKGIINEEDYTEMTDFYADKIIALEKEIEIISLEMRSIVAQKQQRLRWLKDICSNHENLLDRAIVVRLVDTVCVKGKQEIEITFGFTLTN